MIPLFQLSRASLVWLLVSQFLLIAPHTIRLPVWVVIAWCITVLWRVQIFRGVWPYPNRWIKLLILGLSIVGLVSHYGRFYGLEPMVALLITAFILKLLEMQTKREALLIIYLGFFVAAAEFLFHQTFFITLYIFLALTCLTSTLLSIYQSPNRAGFKRTAKLASTMLLQSIPLMVLLFFTMPRIGSLWAVPQPSHTAKSGVSDTMSPGDFSRLVKSQATAFRVRFDGEIPPASQLYWRGIVFSFFDGRAWSQSGFDRLSGRRIESSPYESVAAQNRQVNKDEEIHYQVILEATQQPWLYAIPSATSNTERVVSTSDNRLESRRPVRARFSYEVDSFLNYTMQVDELPNFLRRQNLRLPDNFNPRSVAIANDWLKAENYNQRVYMQRVLSFFNERFVYTLQPPLLGEHSVDEFMWDTQRGFCEHFAGSFVFMMRAAGIPARVVVGYQGGKINPLENFLLVTQADAHAWSEVWFPNEGWIRIDPTAYVAPNRIQQGLDAALDAQEAQLLSDVFSLAHYQHIAILNALKLRLEAFEYNWHSWVMGYDQDAQLQTLKNLLGDITPLRLALFLLCVGGGILGFVGLWLAFSVRPLRHTTADRHYLRFLQLLKAQGVTRLASEGPRGLAKRVSDTRPELAGWVEKVTRCYESIAYANAAERETELKRLVRDQ